MKLSVLIIALITHFSSSHEPLFLDDQPIVFFCKSPILPTGLFSLQNLNNMIIRANYTVRPCGMPSPSIVGEPCVSATLEDQDKILYDIEVPTEYDYKYNKECRPEKYDCLLHVVYSVGSQLPKKFDIELWVNDNHGEVDCIMRHWNCPHLNFSIYYTLLSQAVIATATTSLTGKINHLAVVRKEMMSQKSYNILIYVLIGLAIFIAVVVFIDIMRGFGKRNRPNFSRIWNRTNRIMVLSVFYFK